MRANTASKQYFSMYAAIRAFTTSAAISVSNNQNTHLLYRSTASVLSIFNGVKLDFVGGNGSLLSLATANFNTTNSSVLINNLNKQIGNSGTDSSAGTNIFGNTGNGFSSNFLTTFIQSKNVDTDSQNTAMYNYIRSINNAAF
jgi:hypothetical protein